MDEAPPSEASTADGTAEIPAAGPPRLWPGALILALQLLTLVLSVTPSINNAVRFGFMVGGPALCTLLFIVWLLSASRIPRNQRVWLVLWPIALAAITALLIHPTMGFALVAYGLPFTQLTIWIGLWLTAQLDTWQPRMVGIGAALVLAWAAFPFGKIDGVTGDYLPEVSWRWQPTPEEQLSDFTHAAPTSVWTVTDIAWPGFRGPHGDSRAQGIGRPLDWRGADRPREIWRQPIGPGWSSFAHVSGRLFTQQQRGEQELVTCHDAATGDLIWKHEDTTRFSDPVAGAGPRATPTYSGGKLYTLGARAVLNCLDATDGTLLWQRDLMQELGAAIPVWGFSNSPVLHDDTVVLYVGGRDGHGWCGFDARTGETRWKIDSGGMNFSSAQHATLCGRDVLLCGDRSGLLGIEAASGAVLFRYKPKDFGGAPICQPQVIAPDSLIYPLGDGVGVARLDFSCADEQWTIRERWSTAKLKPSFNDFVYYEGHLYGFDQHIFVCLDAETGERRWKGGRYGFGQVVQLRDTGQMVVAGEDGSLTLLNANPERLEQRGQIATMNAKTWNHPIVVGGQLFVRNNEEAVCLSLE